MDTSGTIELNEGKWTKRRHYFTKAVPLTRGGIRPQRSGAVVIVALTGLTDDESVILSGYERRLVTTRRARDRLQGAYLGGAGALILRGLYELHLHW